MSTSANAEELRRLLDRMPKVSWSSRVTPATGKMEWIYVSPKMAELHGVTDADQPSDPVSLMQRIVPEDLARLERQIAESLVTLAPMSWTGRVVHASGEIRWIETESVFERGAEGTIVSYGNAADITARRLAEEALADSEIARASSDAMYRAVIDALPLGVTVMDPRGRIAILNAAQERMTGPGAKEINDESLQDYGIFAADGVTPLSMTEMPMTPVVTGAVTSNVAELVIRNRFIDGEVRLRSTAVQMRDAKGNVIGALSVSQDITAQRALEQELVARNEQLAQSEEAKTALIDRLRYAIDELSNPILEVWDDVLAMPIIGIVDSRRTADMVQRLLAEVARTQASFVIVDLTGVEVVDTKTADHLMKLMRKVEIVGARCVLTGIRPAVAETLVDIGVDFGSLATLRNLKHGLREALRHAQRERDGARFLSIDGELAEESQQRRRQR
jgi:rsbT co-antagonist protein RsbR